LSTDERTGAGYYTVHIVLPRTELARLKRLTLAPGMPVEVFSRPAAARCCPMSSSPWPIRFSEHSGRSEARLGCSDRPLPAASIHRLGNWQNAAFGLLILDDSLLGSIHWPPPR
ncbi:hypothetical protein, partial [Mesorhizobium sp. M7A.F.Ca.US.007.01.1.1]|uniref:hypothetical protein n=1 Tax=Mesorhizobium sp. M7A.F.Ca.US.007.01.1.1 TaxID=2496712 RepID=UPI001FE19F18